MNSKIFLLLVAGLGLAIIVLIPKSRTADPVAQPSEPLPAVTEAKAYRPDRRFFATSPLPQPAQAKPIEQTEQAEQAETSPPLAPEGFEYNREGMRAAINDIDRATVRLQEAARAWGEPEWKVQKSLEIFKQLLLTSDDSLDPMAMDLKAAGEEECRKALREMWGESAYPMAASAMQHYY